MTKTISSNGEATIDHTEMNYEQFCKAVENGQRLDCSVRVSTGGSDPKPARFPVDPGKPPFQNVALGGGLYLVDFMGDARARREQIVTFQRAIEEDSDINGIHPPNFVVTGVPESPDLPMNTLSHRWASSVATNTIDSKGNPFRTGLGANLSSGDHYQTFQICWTAMINGLWDSNYRMNGAVAGSNFKLPKVVTETIRGEARYDSNPEKFVSSNPLGLLNDFLDLSVPGDSKDGFVVEIAGK